MLWYYAAAFNITLQIFFLSDNWAFLYAQRLALNLEVPLHICFCLVPVFLDATIRHFEFMLKGLKEVQQVCKRYTNQLLFIKSPMAIHTVTVYMLYIFDMMYAFSPSVINGICSRNVMS